MVNDKFPLNVCVLFLIALSLSSAPAARATELNLHIYPNPFFAGYHLYGRGEYAKVAFDIPAGGTASVYVYDFEGNLVRTLFEGKKYGPGKHEKEWDGRDDKSNLVAPGPYVIVLEITIQGESYRDSFVAIANR